MKSILTLCPEATASSSPWAWKAIEAIGRSVKDEACAIRDKKEQKIYKTSYNKRTNKRRWEKDADETLTKPREQEKLQKSRDPIHSAVFASQSRTS